MKTVNHLTPSHPQAKFHGDPGAGDPAAGGGASGAAATSASAATTGALTPGGGGGGGGGPGPGGHSWRGGAGGDGTAPSERTGVCGSYYYISPEIANVSAQLARVCFCQET